MHLNENSEKYSELFLCHEDKQTLILPIDDLRISNDERASGENLSILAIDWFQTTRLMGDLINADTTADLTTLLTKPFSQTTAVQQTVFDTCLMDAIKNYYKYRFFLDCGIPQVTVIGLPDDFQISA
ncbi:unnamed protein product [Rotaria magnacalcarata]|uniref:Uncharacterized protein n=2 Tax=Rotaria magnacalcarata TaxID=392030 RepID=A0A816BKN2_9BILA|nr:unnamed protein product [Rotaria magnacalcarata]CAF4396117.1 unnamed protein product [Rotaria magnacalcarata]